VSHRATPHAAVRTAVPRRTGQPLGRHRRAPRRPLRRAQLIGLTAALAAAAGTSAVGATHTFTPASISAGADASTPRLDAITTARIERRQLASRDAARFELSLQSTRKLQADAGQQVTARAAKLAANQTLTRRRAAALSAARAAAAKAATATQAATAEAAAKRRAAAQAAPESVTARQPEAFVAPGSGGAVLPTSGYHLTALFGQGGGRWTSDHTGTDFAAPIGTPVRAVLAGEVVAAEYAGAYGRQIKVRHADGTVTSYAHLAEFSVSVGASVPVGGRLGSVGVTGNTTGPHLHFEVLLGGAQQVDPVPWLRDHGLTA
jgi:murein DD-endopeptidase MepM/ murein hydrolase activator NlpD